MAPQPYATNTVGAFLRRRVRLGAYPRPDVDWGGRAFRR